MLSQTNHHFSLKMLTPRTWRLIFGLSCIAIVLTTIYHRSTVRSIATNLHGVTLHRPAIPNVLHFTQLQKNEHATLHFSFQDFLAMYSALRLMKPSKIYIHTSFNETMIDRAIQGGSKWTRMMLTAFPDVVQVNYVEALSHVNDREVYNIEAKSDFVRWEQVAKHGGIYLDWDVLTLRDIRVLRESGFNAIVGRQPGGLINSGVFMCQKGSTLAYLMRRDQYIVFDNGWETHAVTLLTHISERLVQSRNEVLIMDEKAFGPTGWWPESVDNLFAPHNDTKIPLHPQLNDPTDNAMNRWDNKARSQEWEMDYSSTYLLHAYKARGHQVPGFEGVSVRYVLDRNSNYALAAWPVIQLGLADKTFSPEDTEV